MTTRIFAFVLMFTAVSAPAESLAWGGYETYLPNGTALSGAIAFSQGTGCPMCHRTTTGGNACADLTCPIACTTTNRCHNTFGVLFMAQGSSWTNTMSQTDSDGDGWSNGQELADPFNRWTYGGSNAYGIGYRSQPGSASSEPAAATNVCSLNLDDCDSLVTCSDAFSGTGGWDCAACPAGYSGSGHDYTSGGWTGGSPPYTIATGTGCADVNECTLYNRCRENDFSLTNSCSNSIGSYDCVCGAGWTESGTGQSRICGDVNECTSYNRCREDDFSLVNSCLDSDGTYDCTCGTGWTETGIGQSRACSDVDECLSFNRCLEDTYGVNGCTDLDGSYDCTCGSGFTETGTGQSRTCVDVDECATLNRCREDDFSLVNVCVDSDGSYDCTCGTGWTETGTGQSRICTDVDECATLNRCREDDFPGVNACSDLDGSYDCACGAGFTETGTGQSRVCADVNECSGSPCGAQGTGCANTVGGYTCTCQNGYAFDGVSCVVANPCLIAGGPSQGGNDCHGNATCTPLGGTNYTCTCQSGYTGTGYVTTGGCTNVNECAGGLDNCNAPNSTCSDTPGSFSCGCQSGFSGNGTVSCNDVNECLDPMDVCPGNAICTNSVGSYRCDACHTNAQVEGLPGSESCLCNVGFVGDGFTCADIDECLTDPCQANEACANAVGTYACLTCDPDATVDRTGATDACLCNAGFSGNGFTCLDVDECAAGLDDCNANATCGNTAGKFECTCNAGYSGDGVSCDDIDECSLGLDDCDANATCGNTTGSFSCACNVGWLSSGSACIDEDECASGSDRCSTNANCTNTAGSHTCACSTGFLGDGIVCVDVDDCASTNCGAGQRCVNQFGTPATCECLAGFTDAGNGTCTSACGNGQVVVGEECDDANVVAGDGCSAGCTIEAGYACYEPANQTSVCTETCGDGLIDAPQESCDDGPNNSDSRPGTCRTNCRLPGCGDGRVDSGEQCDLGAANSDETPDGCRTSCLRAACGDGVVDWGAGEICDPAGGVTLDAAICADSACRATDAGVVSTPSKRGGCAASPSAPTSSWSWLAPLALLLVRRRRSA